MPLLPTPALSHAERDALIAALTARLALADQRIATQDQRIAAQDARIAALEARLNQLTQPPKTPGNSSRPPSQGQKPDLPAPGTDRPPRKSRPGVGRTLHPNPDRVAKRTDAASSGQRARTIDQLWPPARNAPRYSQVPRNPHSRSTSVSNCHPSVRM